MRSTMAVLAASALTSATMATAAVIGPAVAVSPEGRAAGGGTEPVTHEQNDRVPQGARWTQHYFPSSDDSGTELHADVLLPEDLADGEQVPVILSVGPYFSHAGQTFPEGFEQTGPSARFADLIEGADLFERGYAFVMVDSRGFGGSSGCLQFAGPGDQADVRAAVDWAAAQPWSTGAVGMYGKSADAITGLIGNNEDQDALKAVVAQEPIWDLYRNVHSYGVPRTTAVQIPGSYGAIAQIPPLPDDDPRYQANAAYEAEHPECTTREASGYLIGDPESEFWRARDIAALAEGSDTPLLFTQGFLEWNTEAEGMEEFLAHHEGPQRAWLGQWDHVRGNDRLEDGTLAMGREGWFEETMSFYDEHLRGITPSVQYPVYAIQDSTGSWRAQDTWPVVGRSAVVRLGGGRYVDDGYAASEANRYVTRSEPLERPTRITGTPRVALRAEGRGNVMVRLFDVDPDGTAVMFDEQVGVLRSGQTRLDLKSTDWTLAAGHTLAVEIGTVQPETQDLDPLGFGPGSDWIDSPSGEQVRVTSARLDLALDNPADDVPTDGARAPYLDVYLGVRTTTDLPSGPPAFRVPTVIR
ncbi:CocE/NonD family hydrolase [Jannaschia sp. R86511]|uniref:CocE/NonD family hydrolase n=1 Tax=Jannaschia sp. R86511 TaxID=3093853 RepID=UPI0036D29E0B